MEQKEFMSFYLYSNRKLLVLFVYLGRRPYLDFPHPLPINSPFIFLEITSVQPICVFIYRKWFVLVHTAWCNKSWYCI